MSESSQPDPRRDEPIDLGVRRRAQSISEPERSRPRPERLSGRQSAIARAAELVEQSMSALLVGPNGSGKSYAVDRIGHRLRATGRSVQSVNARSGECLAAIDRWQDAPSGSVLIIDDGAALPASAMPAVIELSRSTEHAALITLEPGPSDDHSSSSDRAAARLLSVWRSGTLKRIDLPGLDRAEARALASKTAEDSVIDDMAQATIVRLSNGSPLLITELTKDALETGGGFYRPRSILSLGDAGVSPRVHDLTLPLLERLDDDDRYSLVMLAKLGPTPYGRAARLLGERSLHTLLRHGLARNDGSSLDRVMADELHAWSALSDWRHSWRLRSHDRVQRLLIADLQRGARLTPNEAFIVGRYWVYASDQEILADVAMRTAAEILLDAAHVANVAGLPGDGQLLAARAHGFVPSVAAALQQSRSLAMLGDVRGAVRALQVDAELEAEVDDATRAEQISWSGVLAQWDGPEAERDAERQCATALESSSRELAQRAELTDVWRSATTRGPSPADEVFARVLNDPTAGMSGRLYAGAGLLSRIAPFRSMEQARKVLEAGDAVQRSVPYTSLQPLSHSLRDASALYFLTAGLVRIEAGFSWTAVERSVEEFAVRAGTASGQLATVDQCVVGLLTGTLALLDHDPERAVADLTVVEGLLDSTLPPDVHAHTSLTLALALVATGDVEAALRRRDSVDRDLVAASGMLEALTDLLDVALRSRASDAETATTFVRRLASDRSKSISERVMMAHSSRLVGTDAATAVAWVDDVRGAPMTPLPSALLTLLDAEASDDATLAERAARALEQIGARHRSAMAYRFAEELHRSADRPSHARRCAERAARLVADLDTPDPGTTATAWLTPDIAPAAVPNAGQTIAVDLSGLTKRELEIARLVSQGLSNQEIADRLFLSVRTVESHVLQARTKLGAARRRDLGRLVAFRPDGT